MTGESRSAADRRFMAQALALAALGEGTTSPNPRVGSVVVNGGRIVGGGFHRMPGAEHAEVMALQDAGDDAVGGTLYVNLEPCSHHGRTPPCCDLILQSGIRRVVVAIADPNPLVDGRGLSWLRQAGLQVDVGVLRAEARTLNGPFLKWHENGIPLVSIKSAVSADGMISARNGNSRWITGQIARRFAHRLRYMHDAILVGAGTVRHDDPGLTTRLPGKKLGRGHLAVLSGSLDIDPEARIFNDHPGSFPKVRIYSGDGADPARLEGLRQVADVIQVPDADGKADLRSVLQDLGKLGVQSVLVEGGAGTTARFLESRLADRAYIFTAPTIIGSRGGTPAFDMDAVTEPPAGFRLVNTGRITLGEDLLLWGSVEYP